MVVAYECAALRAVIFILVRGVVLGDKAPSFDKKSVSIRHHLNINIPQKPNKQTLIAERIFRIMFDLCRPQVAV